MSEDSTRCPSGSNADVSHTLGPWKVESPVDNAGQMVYVQISAGKYRIGTTGVYGKKNGQTTGNVYKDDIGITRHRPHVTAEEAMANAHLIAAAPDLLAACKSLVDAWHADDDNFQRELDDGTPDALRLARAAIAKATSPH